VAEAWWFAAALEEARGAVRSGNYAGAYPRLARLAARRPGEAEVEYLLGVCAQAAGHPAAAVAAWARVPAGSPFAADAATRRARVELDRGRLAAAEAAVAPFTGAGGEEGFTARRVLADVFWLQGRLEEVRELTEANWAYLRRTGRAASPEAVVALRTHVTLDLFPLPAEELGRALAGAAAKAPGDDRVGLGLARLAARAGRFDEAQRRLGDCLRRRPGDPAVWRAVLDLALATGQADRAREALAWVPAERTPPGRLEALRAWFAARRGDAAAERAALARAAEADPGDVAALARLADLAAAAGEADRAAALRRRKAALDQAVSAYRHLFDAGRPDRDARELARLAERLGRRFEARGFLALVARRGPEDPEIRSSLVRLADTAPPLVPAGRTLADLLAPDLGPGAETTRTAADRSPRVRVPQFRDDATAAGLRFTFENGATPLHQLPEMASGGIGLIDADGDGWLDVYVVQGGTFPTPPGAPPNQDRLYRNRGDGTFEDATAASGLADLPGGYGHGVAVGDVDNDGRPDLFLTRWRSYALFRNRGDGTFEDATARWGLGGDRDWPTSAAFADLDGDGDLDLYVCHYGVWDPEHPQLCRGPSADGYVTCSPHLIRALPDHVFRNDGGRFVDVSEQAGVTAADADGRGLGVVAADLDEDGKVDLFVTNDGTANYLFRNLGGFRFEEVGHAAGVASNANGGYQAGMGVACGDLDADGRPDLVVTNFYGESTSFFRNLGGGLFADQTTAAGLAAPSRFLLGFGVAFLDADNDGRLDLLTVNGHVSDFRPKAAYAMPAQLLLGGVGGRLTNASADAGAPFRAAHLSRGLAVGDLDNDGRVDALVVNQNEPLAFFHNATTSGGRFVALRLEGTASHRDAVGAAVVLDAGGRRRYAARTGGGSYQSAGDPRLHVGLGDACRVDRLEVRWPSGRVDRYEGLPADTGYLLREGDPSPRPLQGWPR
jgi:thioredoxin-like negative regulator of GroEL